MGLFSYPKRKKGLIFIYRKNFQLDKKYFKPACYIFGVIALSIIMEKLLANTTGVGASIISAFNTITAIIAPFIYGFSIAYILNPIVIFIENRALGKLSFFNKRPDLNRGISIFLTFTGVIGGLLWMTIFFLPDTIQSIKSFFNMLPLNLVILDQRIRETVIEFNLDYDQIYVYIEEFYTKFINLSRDFPNILSKVVASTILAASTIIKLIMGIFIAFYMLFEKEGFCKTFKRIIYALSVNDEKSDRFILNLGKVHNIFQRFILGKTIDSLIIGVLCFVVMSLFKLPYSGLISIIVGVTNMIPYFGPFIGGIPAVLIILIVRPESAFLMFMIILIIQQLDGNFIGPKILGASVGANPILIIAAIVIGGAVAGPLGMFLGVPILASMRLFFFEYIDKKYEEKYEPPEVI